MMTKEEYEQTYIRMMDGLRSEVFKGGKNCGGVDCHACPIQSICEKQSLTFNAPAVVEVVEQWGKEHSIVTKADKFKEVFGNSPKPYDEVYLCPKRLGFEVKDCYENSCTLCAKAFWESEYVAPTIGTVTPNTEILNG